MKICQNNKYKMLELPDKGNSAYHYTETTKHVARYFTSNFLWYITYTKLHKPDTLFYYLVII